MKWGVTFPQFDIGTDPQAIRAFAQAAEDLGFDHLTIYDHLLGADPAAQVPGWFYFYDHRDPFHEPFVIFAFLAAVTRRIEFFTGILLLSARPAVLVAKQAAEIDLLSGGRLRLGIGIGQNEAEHEALGQDFRTRGRRCEEQIEVMRSLWTHELVDFQGRWHNIRGGGINPLPLQRPIPIWIGGHAEAALRRTARIADGWTTYLTADEKPEEVIAEIHRYAVEAGRDPAEIGIEARVCLDPTPIARGRKVDPVRTPEAAAEEARRWETLGATHVTFNSNDVGMKSADLHIDAIRRFREALGD